MRSKADRVAAAQAGSVAERHVIGHGDQAATCDQLWADLDAGHGEALDAALAEIHDRSTDPNVLTQAAARFTEPGDVAGLNERILRLLVLAGADEEEARRIMAGRGGGWVTPQAEAWTERHEPGY